MKSYRQQFADCTREGYTGKTETFNIKDYSMPKQNKFIAIDIVRCGRFGGRCNSHNDGCIKLRKESF